MAILYIRAKGAELREASLGQTITLAEWREGVRPEAGRFELAIANDVDVESIGDVIARFEGVILDFPSFKDGRAYSQARLMRERLGYKGEIRAAGEVLCDQALFMLRAGFDSLDIGEGNADGFLAAIGAYSRFYQRAADGSTPIAALRSTRRKAA